MRLILEKIVNSQTTKLPENIEMDYLQYKLRKEIEGKRYNLVLDDMWNEDKNGLV